MRLRAASGARQVRPAFVRPTVSIIWEPRITVTSASSATLPGASTGITATAGVRKSLHHPRERCHAGTAFPLYLSLGARAVSELPVRILMPLYLPGYYNQNKTQMAEHYNLSIQRQLDKSTVLTVAYVGTQGHHIEHGVPMIYGSAALCQSLAGCGPGGEGGVYHQNGQTYYGTFTGADRQPDHQPELQQLRWRSGRGLRLRRPNSELGKLELQLTAGFGGTPRSRFYLPALLYLR